MWIRFESDYITTVLQKTDIQTEKNTETDEEIVTRQTYNFPTTNSSTIGQRENPGCGD